ncbi:MAG: hypothetical protein OEU92_24720, partial [Alphaproteobacteria bacterium]|nr:hypothetical protein [Alphaproteobacteria bacterium]
IQTDRANLTHGWLPSCGSKDTAFWHIAMPVGEPSTASTAAIHPCANMQRPAKIKPDSLKLILTEGG